MSMSDENTINESAVLDESATNESSLSIARTDAFKYLNTIEELTRMLSERCWRDEEIKDRFVLAALADGANAAAIQLQDLVELSDMN